MSDSTAADLQEKGLALFRRGEHAKALETFKVAADAYAAAEDSSGEGEMLNNIGVIYRLQGNTSDALAVFKEAETIFHDLAAWDQKGQVLGNLGDLHAANRNRDEAARCYSDAAALFAGAGEPEKQSQVLRALSLLRLRQGSWLEAMMRMEESLSCRPRISLPQRMFRGILRFALNLFTGR